MLEVKKTALPGVLEIIPKRFGDDRGYFVETFNADRLKHVGLDVTFCQDNHSYSRDIGVLRGLHYQMAPFAQDKLVRVTRGRVFDVAVDLRQGSQTYSKWVGVELSAEKGNQLFIPQGFAHAFLTLEHDCEFQYKVSAYYSPEHDRSIRFDDPQINIVWPDLPTEVKLSDKDAAAPYLAQADNNFFYASNGQGDQ